MRAETARYGLFEMRGAANDNSRVRLVFTRCNNAPLNHEQQAAKRRGLAAAPLAVVTCRAPAVRGTESFVSALPRLEAWMPMNASPAFKFAGTSLRSAYDAAYRVTRGRTTSE